MPTYQNRSKINSKRKFKQRYFIMYLMLKLELGESWSIRFKLSKVTAILSLSDKACQQNIFLPLKYWRRVKWGTLLCYLSISLSLYNDIYLLSQKMKALLSGLQGMLRPVSKACWDQSPRHAETSLQGMLRCISEAHLDLFQQHAETYAPILCHGLSGLRLYFWRSRNLSTKKYWTLRVWESESISQHCWMYEDMTRTWRIRASTKSMSCSRKWSNSFLQKSDSKTSRE